MHSTVPTDEPCSPQCQLAIRKAFDLLATKWSVPIIIALRDASGPLRYAELQRRVGSVTPKELAKHLRRLEGAALIRRRVYATVPPGVEYALTDLAYELYPRLQRLADWGAKL